MSIPLLHFLEHGDSHLLPRGRKFPMRFTNLCF
jgi:hypothetical protein